MHRIEFDVHPGRRVALCAVALAAGVITILAPLESASALPTPGSGRPPMSATPGSGQTR